MALVRLSKASPNDPEPAPTLAPWLRAFEGWCRTQRQAGRLRRAASETVYRAMWQALAAWCVAQRPPVRLATLDATTLQAYLTSRHGTAGPDESLTPRYQARLLRLVQRVQDQRAAGGATDGAGGAAAAGRLIATQPALRHAQDADNADLPAHLPAGDARLLLRWLTGRTPPAPDGSPSAGQAAGQAAGRWQAQRDRCAVALQLGAGLGPGDLRALRLGDVVRAGSGGQWLPAELRVPASGSAPAHVTPMAPWAARLLDAWLQRRQAEALGGDWLFPSTRSGKPWGKVAQYESARRVLGDAGLDPGAGGSFRLRHTFALRQLRRGCAPEDVARWLGVADPAVMARYQRLLAPPDADLATPAPGAAGSPALARADANPAGRPSPRQPG